MESKDIKFLLNRRATPAEQVYNPGLHQGNGQSPGKEVKASCNSQKCEEDANASSLSFNSWSQTAGVKVD